MNRVASYTVGLVLALVLTLAAFSLTFAHTSASLSALPSRLLIPSILALAMAQLVVQLVFFLHLGQSKASKWNALMFCFTFFAVLTVVAASVWIMYHLNNNMTPAEMEQYISNQSGF